MDAYVEKDAAGVDSHPPGPLTPDPAGALPGGPSTGPAGADPGGPSTGRDPSQSGRATGGIMALSLPYQVVLAVALAVTGVFACVHLAMVFLHVAPSNTLTKQHGQAVDDWIYPEFEQNWKLFAPNPLQQNVSVEARAEISTGDGTLRTSGWIDLTAQDIEAVRHNPMPSHTQQNELRRAIDFYFGTHAEDHRPQGARGELSERYMRRIAVFRLDALPSLAGTDGRGLRGEVRRVQLRAVSRPVPAPAWSTEKTDTAPSYRDLPWWRVTDADRPAGADRSRTEAGR
ncbi:DUF5819 family protein [Streptomyces sp. NPDC101490]|uniref:DUF5819 family protein n=1 Tax=Streptomyces sp. NPDC101490 TaxID=3366143 RepID=UPI0038056F31